MGKSDTISERRNRLIIASKLRAEKSKQLAKTLTQAGASSITHYDLPSYLQNRFPRTYFDASRVSLPAWRIAFKCVPKEAEKLGELCPQTPSQLRCYL
jgi:hypothetical protein